MPAMARNSVPVPGSREDYGMSQMPRSNGQRPGYFEDQLEAAYRQQLRDNQASMSRFITTVAAICETWSNELDANTIASRLREIDNKAMASPSPPPPTVAPTLATVPLMMDMNKRSPRDDVSSRGGGARGNKFHPEHGVEEMASFRTHASVLEDASINKLPFIEDDGNIEAPKPALRQLLGPGYSACVDSCQGSLAGWKPIQGSFANFVQGNFFGFLSTSIIISNFAYIIMNADYKIENPGKDDPEHMVIIGHCFTAWYTIEMFCAMAVQGKDYILGPEYGWNVFDIVIVGVSWFEIIAELLGGSSGGASFLKVLRFFRISRILRMFAAMRMFKEIKIMVDCLAGSIGIFFFCSVMLVLFLSMFAVFFVQGVGAFLEKETDLDPVLAGTLKEQYGTVFKAILSLFICATGGDDWANYYNVIKVVGVQHNLLFLFFVDFYMFAFVNVVTGVFCEKAVSLATPSVEELVAQRYETEFVQATELYELLSRHLSSHSEDNHTISVVEFNSWVEVPAVNDYFKVKGMKTSVAKRFFKLLCEIYESDAVDYKTFVSSVVLLDGQASGMDLHVVSVRQLQGLHQLKSELVGQHHELRDLHEDMKDQLLSLAATHDATVALKSTSNGNSNGNGDAQSYAAGLRQGREESERLRRELDMVRMQRASQPNPEDAERFQHFGTKLQTLESEIKEMTIMQKQVARLITEREAEMMKAFMSRENTVNSSLDGSMLTPRSRAELSSPQHLKGAPSNASTDPPPDSARRTALRLRSEALEHQVNELQQQMEETQRKESELLRKENEASEAAVRSNMNLESAQLRIDQLERICKLQDQREAELHRTTAKLQLAHDNEMKVLEKTKEEMRRQVRFQEFRLAELQKELTAKHIEPPSSMFGRSCGPG